LALLPDRRAGIAVLANGDGGSAPINAVVQQVVALAADRPRHTGRQHGRVSREDADA
jgi:hypothetical protein